MACLGYLTQWFLTCGLGLTAGSFLEVYSMKWQFRDLLKKKTKWKDHQCSGSLLVGCIAPFSFADHPPILSSPEICFLNFSNDLDNYWKHKRNIHRQMRPCLLRNAINVQERTSPTFILVFFSPPSLPLPISLLKHAQHWDARVQVLKGVSKSRNCVVP